MYPDNTCLISLVTEVNPEGAFSFIRFNYRKRPLMNTLDEEAKYVASLFFDEQNRKRFSGLLRNHFRVLRKYFVKYIQDRVNN